MLATLPASVTEQESARQGGHDDGHDEQHKYADGDEAAYSVIHVTTLGMPACLGPTR